MFGEEPNQQRARRTFPILTDRAMQGKTITYGEIANILEMGTFGALRVGTTILPIITKSLGNMEERYGVRLPRLANIVIRSDGNIGSYPYKQLKEVLGRNPTWEDYERELLTLIYNYDRWDYVIEKIEEMISEYEGKKDVR